MSLRVVAIVQARMGSTRLPGKVMKQIMGRPMLWHVVSRAEQIQGCQRVVIATTMELRDEKIYEYCLGNLISCSRGSEENVLDRCYRTAKKAGADVVIRLTADCPVLDPVVSGKVLDYYLRHDYDYVSNVHPPTYPDGLDTEVFSFSALKRAWQDAKKDHEREHVTPYLYMSGHFKIGNVRCHKDYSDRCWTVDLPQDLERIRQMYGELGLHLRMDDVLALLKRRPELDERREHANRSYKRRVGYE